MEVKGMQIEVVLINQWSSLFSHVVGQFLIYLLPRFYEHTTKRAFINIRQLNY